MNDSPIWMIVPAVTAIAVFAIAIGIVHLARPAPPPPGAATSIVITIQPGTSIQATHPDRPCVIAISRSGQYFTLDRDTANCDFNNTSFELR